MLKIHQCYSLVVVIKSYEKAMKKLQIKQQKLVLSCE